MSVIKITVDEQNLYITDSPKIAAQGVNENQVEFIFSSDWDGFGKTANFYLESDPETIYTSLVDANGFAPIPYEITSGAGRICIGVSGVKNYVVKTTEILIYKIVKGLYVAETSQPSPGIYEQILTAIGKMHTDLAEFTESIRTEQTDFENDVNDLIDNTPYLTAVEDEEFELPIHTINDEDNSENSTWSSAKIKENFDGINEKLNNVGIMSVIKTITIAAGTTTMQYYTVDFSNDLPAGARIVGINVLLDGIALPYVIESGEVKTWISVVTSRTIRITNKAGAYINYPLYATIFYQMD